MLAYLSCLNNLLLKFVQTDFLVANTNANYQNSDRRNDLSHAHLFTKDENVSQHRIDNIDKADERDEACIATLESNCLTHDTDGIESSCTKQDQVVEWAEVEYVQGPICKGKCQGQVCRCDKDAKETVIEEHDSVGHIL